ncbi:hypothetical protein DFS34DRAFT_649322 [Phlyctochytrium arcticum]|nr:hypothetical protein DFS34DRAFT_649322 [Phlyctochytrium arcticum]
MSDDCEPIVQDPAPEASSPPKPTELPKPKQKIVHAWETVEKPATQFPLRKIVTPTKRNYSASPNWRNPQTSKDPDLDAPSETTRSTSPVNHTDTVEPPPPEAPKRIVHAWETVEATESAPKPRKPNNNNYKYEQQRRREQELIDQFWGRETAEDAAFARKVDAFFESAKAGAVGTLNVQAASDTQISRAKDQNFEIPDAVPVAERVVSPVEASTEDSVTDAEVVVSPVVSSTAENVDNS